nr:hypothetical protein [Pseudomonas sp.]
MKKNVQKHNPSESKSAAQLKATIARITAALETLVEAGESFKNISKLAEAVSKIVGIDRSLLLRNDKTYRKSLDRFPVLLGKDVEAVTPYNMDIDPLHPVMINNSALEHENIKLRNIVDDLSKRVSEMARQRRNPITESASAACSSAASSSTEITSTAASSRVEYQWEFEMTCQLVDKILEHKRAIRIVDNTLKDLSDVSGIPKVIADAKLIEAYLGWRNSRVQIG